MQSPAPASSLAEPPPAASPQLGRWLRQQGLQSARMRCLLLVLAAARVLLCWCWCCFDDDCSFCFFTFGHISYWYDSSRASYYYCCIYLLSVQSPAPASILAEPPPAASPQRRRWVCQQGLRSARIRGLLLVLAAASVAAAAASTTTALPCLFTFGYISYWYGRKHYCCCYGFSRYGIRVTLLYALVRES